MPILPILLPGDNFPDPTVYNSDGVVCFGGSIDATSIEKAFTAGIFPWFHPEIDPITWYSPEERMVLQPDEIYVSDSMRRLLKKGKYRVSMDTSFMNVLEGCASSGTRKEGTWLSNELMNGYYTLHQKGIAHSVEVWEKDVLVGGLFGLSKGKIFSGESMFSTADNASKYGFISLCKVLSWWNFLLIDCQVYTDHLRSLGAYVIPRKEYLKILKQAQNEPSNLSTQWTIDFETAIHKLSTDFDIFGKKRV